MQLRAPRERYWRGVITMNDYRKNVLPKTWFALCLIALLVMKKLPYGLPSRKTLVILARQPRPTYASAHLDERADICVCDPKVTEKDMFMEFQYTLGITEESLPGLKSLISIRQDPYEAAKGAHAIAVMTEWDEFKEYDYVKIYENMQKPAFIFDGRNILDHKKLKEIGFEVHAIGKTF